MRQILQILIVLILFSCSAFEKEQPVLHGKTTPFSCDSYYFTKLAKTGVNMEHIIPSDDGNGFYALTDSGVRRYDFEGIQKRWENIWFLEM